MKIYYNIEIPSQYETKGETKGLWGRNDYGMFWSAKRKSINPYNKHRLIEREGERAEVAMFNIERTS